MRLNTLLTDLNNFRQVWTNLGKCKFDQLGKVLMELLEIDFEGTKV